MSVGARVRSRLVAAGGVVSRRPAKVRRYAEGTTVATAASKAELEELLRRHGATGFFSSWDDETKRAVVGFRMRERYQRAEFDLDALRERVRAAEERA